MFSNDLVCNIIEYLNNNINKEITIDEIVKNDILILAPGNKVPADGILIKGKLSVDESSLNGETKEVYKEYIDNIKDLDNIENITTPIIFIFIL